MIPKRVLSPEQKQKAADATRRWKSKHPEYKDRRNAIRRGLPSDHPYRIKAKKDTAAWKQKHPGYDAELAQVERLKLLELWDSRCVRCGYNENHRALEIDHINGDGYLERNQKEYRGSGRNYTGWRKMLNDPDVKLKYQVLCANCHRIKTFENNEHRKREPS